MTNGPDLLLQPYRPQTVEEQQQMIDRARTGDLAAREAIITSCLNYVKAVARTLSLSHQVEYEELVGIGNLTLVEKLDIALTKDNAFPYLKACVKRGLTVACQRWWYLLELAKGTTYPDQVLEQEPDYTFLYEAINRLPSMERAVVAMYYGLLDSPKESLYQLSLATSANPKGTAMYQRLRRARVRLRSLLVQTSGQGRMGSAYPA